MRDGARPGGAASVKRAWPTLLPISAAIPTAFSGTRSSKQASVRIDFRTRDNLGNKDDIEVVLAWKPDRGLIASFPNVKLIVSLGMGVDHLLADDKLPAGVPITRIMDDGLVGQMSEYAIY